jgi:hypothetical protein
MGRFSLILIVGLAIVAGAMKITYNEIGAGSQNISSEKFNHFTARDAAYSASEILLYYLSLDKHFRSSFSGVNLGNCDIDADIQDSSDDSNLGNDTLRLVIASSAAGELVDLQVMVALNSLSWPAPVDAGITARCDVLTLGTLIVDGRNHDWFGNVLPNDGVMAITTTQDLTRQGASTLGGTMASGTDMAPSKFNTDLVSEEYKSWVDGYPTTPDAVLGITAGTLKSLAVNGINGGQYVTDPANLTYPLGGVTYLELPSGGEWLDAELGADAQGIIVVHNDDYNAKLKNLEMGEFRGLIIVDDMIHIHADIYGAVFLLTAGPSEGNCIGNGEGMVLFSKEAIMTAINESGVKGDSLSVISYYE